MHQRVASMLLAALAVVSVVTLVQEAQPGASAPLADIRTTPPLDNFNRANENPIAAPWVPRVAGGARGRLFNQQLINVNTSTFIDVYTAAPNSTEVWAQTAGNLDQQEFWYIALLANPNGSGVLDGYAAQYVDPTNLPPRWNLLRYDNGVLSQPLATAQVTASLPSYFLLRREGGDVVIYRSGDSGANWTQDLRHADATYTTGLYPGLGIGTIDATGPSWDNLGGGPGGTPPTQLTVVKNVINDNGGSAVPANWTMTVAGPTPLTFPGADSPGTTNAVQPGAYQVTESGGPTGYSLSYSGHCDADGDVTLASGETKTCTLTNNDPVPPPAGPPTAQTFGAGAAGRGIHAWCACGFFADPVSSRTGAFTTSFSDLETPGTGVPFAWHRSYTSADPTVGRLGLGWTESYSASLAVQPNGDVLLHGEDGQQLSYTQQANGSFLGGPGSLSTLASVAGGYELVTQDQVVYAFTSSGRLNTIKDRNNQGVTLAYDGQNRLSTITDAAGKQVTVGYNASNLVNSVSTQDGRSVSYGYTSGRHLAHRRSRQAVDVRLRRGRQAREHQRPPQPPTGVQRLRRERSRADADRRGQQDNDLRLGRRQ
jgi:YD repeat-containing protein